MAHPLFHFDCLNTRAFAINFRELLLNFLLSFLLFADISLCLREQIMGGILLGLATGYIAYQILKRLDE